MAKSKMIKLKIVRLAKFNKQCTRFASHVHNSFFERIFAIAPANLESCKLKSISLKIDGCTEKDFKNS